MELLEDPAGLTNGDVALLLLHQARLLLALARPVHPREVVRCQARGIRVQALPAPTALRCGIWHAHRAVGLEPGRDQEPPVAGGAPQALGRIPTSGEHMRARAGDRHKALDQLDHQVQFAAEGHPRGLADRLLLVELRCQGAAAAQEYVEPSNQGVPAHVRARRRGVVPPYPLHLLAFGLGHRRVVADQVPGHNGLRRTAPTPWARLPLPLLFGLDHGRHLCSEARQPELHEVCGLPRRVREEPAHAGQTRTVRDLAQQARQGPRFVAQEQAQQHGHDVLILRLAQTGAERLHPLAHTGIEAYNRDRHGGLLATRVAEHPLATRPRCHASTPPPKTAKIELVRYMVNIGAAGPGRDPRTMAELAALAEASGWDGISLEDYLVYQGRLGTPTYDPWVALAAMALSTTRIRLGTLVTPLSRRRPWKLASEAVTLDWLSRGRRILGVGAGDGHDPSFRAAGEPTEPRVLAERLDEGLEILAGLWSGEPVSFQGKHYHVSGLRLSPTPVQQPRIP